MKTLIKKMKALRIYAVMLSLRSFSTKLQSEQGFLFFFKGGKKYF